MIEAIFWLCVFCVWYAYMGYPLTLIALGRIRGIRARPPADVVPPTVTMIIPAHNEAGTIGAKLENTRLLDYPPDRLEILYVSDGSTDGTTEVLRADTDSRSRTLVLAERSGKAAGLNAALQEARHDIVVFSDAAIMLAPDSLRRLVGPFAVPEIGCVSGEDHILQSGGEALYGRYELFMRRQESELCSIVGASGSFYAQRRTLCEPFLPNLAPDFLSVLRTVERGYLAVTEPGATGTMNAVSSVRDEFRRKARTLLRGITTLRHYAHLLNPFRFGWFAFALFSHKLMRWLVPFFLVGALATNAVLAFRSIWYLGLLLAQVVFYGLAVVALTGWRPLAGSLPVKVAVYFTTVNLATLSAWGQYFAGARQELWSPSKR